MAYPATELLVPFRATGNDPFGIHHAPDFGAWLGPDFTGLPAPWRIGDVPTDYMTG